MDIHKKNKSIADRKRLSGEELEKKIEHFLFPNHANESQKISRAKNSFFKGVTSIARPKYISKLGALFKLERKKLSVRFRFSALRQISLRAFSRRTSYTAIVILLILVVSCIAYYRKYIASAATFTWVQSSWTGGASTTAPYPTHPTDETGWTKYYSKSGVDTTSGVTLERTSN
ncbi:MAG TPA: hypothetical protein VK254_02100 [Candidatus Bathyarchaeia archaeon]|nr:hypothetical protein [Candidatus Bathyarchaeia archaeon]